MKQILIRGGLGAALFVGTVLGLLAAQGRLNHAGTQGIPVLSSFFPAPPEPPPETAGEGKDKKAAEHAAGHGDEKLHATRSHVAGHGSGAHGDVDGRSQGLGKEPPLPYRQGDSLFGSEAPKGGGRGGGERGKGGDAHGKGGDHGARGGDHGADATHGAGALEPDAHGDAKGAAHATPDHSTEWKAKVDSVLGQGQYRPGRLWTFPQMESGVSVEELNDVLRRAKEERAALERDRSAIAAHRRELEARERDIADRQDAVMEKLREVEQLRGKLQGEIDEFHDTVLLIRQDEASGLQSVAKTLAAVEPKNAATVIKKWWETDEGQSRALKIWTVMEAEAANAILAELDVDMIRQVLEKRLEVVREQAKAKKQ